MSLAAKTIFITGASRGIGLAIGLRAAREGANIVIAAKTTAPHRYLPGTIYSAAAAVEAAGGSALPVAVDVRDERSIDEAVAAASKRFGGIDICVNNASAINLAGTADIDSKRFDLLQHVNVRGTFLVTRACLPFLKAATNPHILTLCPPITLRPAWLGAHPAYTVSKYAMSLLAIGFADEFRHLRVASNGLWPRTTIATAAIQFAIADEAGMRRSRTADIVADAACAIFHRRSSECTGNLFLDEQVLAQDGVFDLSRYRVDPATELADDLFVDPADPVCFPKTGI